MPLACQDNRQHLSGSSPSPGGRLLEAGTSLECFPQSMGQKTGKGSVQAEESSPASTGSQWQFIG